MVSYERISIVTRIYMYPKRSLDCAYMYMYMTQKFFMSSKVIKRQTCSIIPWKYDVTEIVGRL